MDRNSGVTPMDFEYEQPKSQLAGSNTPFGLAMKNLNHTAQKRSHSALDSPSKPRGFGIPDPNRVRLRDPTSQTVLFDQSNISKPLPSTPSQSNSLWALRTPKSVVDSSGGETPNDTPGADSEATPEGWGRSRKASSPKKSSRRGSFMEGVKSMLTGGSPSRKREYYSTKVENRVHKRRQKQASSRRHQDDDESESEQERTRRRREKKPEENGAAHPPQPEPAGSGMGNFFSYLEQHPGIPHVLANYLQFLLNSFLVFSIMYILYSFWAAIQSEVDVESKKAESDILVEIAMCAANYRDNRCDRSTRVPAMENACSNWESCMNRDSKKIARASVSAKTFATIFNSFVEEFSYKSMFFTAIIIFTGFNLSNWAFGYVRQRHPPTPHHQQPDFQYPPPPATPQRVPSGGFIDYNGQPGYFTPYGTHGPSQSMPSLIEGAGVGAPSPSKKLMFR